MNTVNSPENFIPHRYKGLDSETLNEMRQITYFTDEQKTQQEREKKMRAIERLQQQEKQQIEAHNLQQDLLKDDTERPWLYDTVIDSKTYELPEKERELLKETLKKKVDSLPDNMVYLTHITSEDTASKIYRTQFQYSLGTGLNGTFGVGISKETIFAVLSQLIDWHSPHRNQYGMFLAAIPKDELQNIGKLSSDNIETYLIETYPEMSEWKIPTRFNFWYFKNGTLFTK